MNKQQKNASGFDIILLNYRYCYNFMRRCVKPSMKEYKALLRAHSIGILCIGALGYCIKVVHIPINNIIVK